MFVGSQNVPSGRDKVDGLLVDDGSTRDLKAIAIAFAKEFDDGFEVVGFFVRDRRLIEGDFVGNSFCVRRLEQ